MSGVVAVAVFGSYGRSQILVQIGMIVLDMVEKVEVFSPDLRKIKLLDVYQSKQFPDGFGHRSPTLVA